VDGKAGWLSGSGGYSGAGCDGRFDALPMSGDVKKADPSLYAQWTFDPGSRHQCEVALYIPNNADKMYVGGSPAHYTVEQGKKRILSFSIDQPRSLGRWVSSAVFKVDGPFSVRLANTGKDWTDTKNTFTHVVAAQARTTCS
jgi:translation initiation factor IF-2